MTQKSSDETETEETHTEGWESLAEDADAGLRPQDIDGYATAGERPTQRVYRLLAALEERQGGDSEAVRRWLLRAASAAPGAAWMCAKCGAASDRWRARCDACDAFDSLEWKLPPRAASHEALGAPKALAPVVDAASTRE